MLRNNNDGVTTWNDHRLPQLAYMDGSTIGVTWHDFRDDPLDAFWENRTNTVRYSGGTLLSTTQSAAWPAGTNAAWNGPNYGINIGENDRPANARLHAHFFTFYPQTFPTTGLGTIETVWSPSNYQDH